MTMTTTRACTRSARRHGGLGTAIPLGIAVLVAAWCMVEPGGPRPTWAAGDEAGAGGAGGAAGGERSGPRVFFAGAQSDTLDYEWRDVFPVAVARLERDHWVIQQADTADRRVVTRWKTMDHALTRLTMGDIKARCVVDLAPLPGGRTAIRLRAGLASADDLSGNPLFGAAQSAYRKAGRKYLAGVRATLERSNATASGASGSDAALNP